jgi:hypothetical protein
MLNRMLLLKFVTLAIALASTGATVADVYKWVDENDVVHYSEIKPLGYEAENLRPRSDGTTDEEARGKLEALIDRAQNQGVGPTPDDQAQALARAARLKKNCDTARENLRLLESGVRIRANDADGSAHFLDDDTRQTKLAESQSQIQANCTEG